ncbi:ABC transporter ATP-binding protein [Pseudodesulfovibrio tunisiensis]|uniref:ABC transporter ATP-binding protein n=1 Tax=Pseudodesulfovibrio tunisiensis TaxID=463192 RepID=UPI001FB4B861|nr:ATP-binding cassette domain-containing protein [Pseudodesulfovibrio tunisiensis]
MRRSLFRYGSYQALHDISFDIYPGETLGLLGRNGAGKSTLLRLIANIYQPSRGRIVCGEPVSTALLTLQTGFLPDLSGRDNAIMGAMLYGYSKEEARQRLDDIIRFSGLEEWIDEPIKMYSSGMRARLGFTVAMEMSTDVLLVDEILGVGDYEFRQKSTARIKAKIKSGQTVVLVSHAIPVVRELCTRVAWIENGEITRVGDVDDVVEEYISAQKK